VTDTGERWIRSFYSSSRECKWHTKNCKMWEHDWKKGTTIHEDQCSVLWKIRPLETL